MKVGDKVKIVNLGGAYPEGEIGTLVGMATLEMPSIGCMWIIEGDKLFEVNKGNPWKCVVMPEPCLKFIH